MSSKLRFSGINIQYPISQKILSGDKTIETRTYPLPSKYENTVLLLVETPGQARAFASRIVGKITFGKSFRYANKKAFYQDKKRHLVDLGSKWAWREKPKWGWPIKKIVAIKSQKPSKRLGIVFTKDLSIR